MKYLSTLTIIILTILGSTAINHAQEPSFRDQFNRLSATEQAKIKSEATQKEDYSQMPSIKTINEKSVVDFCKLLPRGLETMFSQKVAENKTATEARRAVLWSRYLSCQDSVLYYEGHRFFKSGHYSEVQLTSAISEIKKVMNWLVQQEQRLDSLATN